jgi:hypothetical protein
VVHRDKIPDGMNADSLVVCCGKNGFRIDRLSMITKFVRRALFQIWSTFIISRRRLAQARIAVVLCSALANAIAPENIATTM